MSQDPFAPFAAIAEQLPVGGSMRLPPVPLSHFPIADTALAAALFSLGIAKREPGPFTRDVILDARGNETQGQRILWWVGSASADGVHKTQEIAGWWENRFRFEAEHPLHPLVAMRAAYDARSAWLRIMHGVTPMALEPAADAPCYVTDSLHGASVLVASGYRPYAFSGRAFYVARAHGGVHAEQLLQTAAQPSGATAAQAMSFFLRNYGHLLKIAKEQGTILQHQFGQGVTMLLTEDSTAKTRDKFFKAKRELL